MSINAGSVLVADVGVIQNGASKPINILNVIQNGVTTTVWTRAKVLFDLGDSMLRRWRRDSGPDWYFGECQTNGAADTWNQIDCTNFRYCTVRINGNIDSTPGGSAASHTWIKIGFTEYADLAIGQVGGENLVHKWASSSAGNIGSGTDGLAYDKWYDLTLDVSGLSGVHSLNVFVGGAANNSGTLHCSKITMHN